MVIAETAKKHPDKPVVDVPSGGEDFMLVYEALRNINILVYNLPEKVARALKVLRTYYQMIAKARG